MGDNSGPQPFGEVGLKERFFRYFQHEVTALQEQMGRLHETSLIGGERNDAIDLCLAGIERLSHEVKDASSYIPAYDQRTYAETIKALSEKLQSIRASFAPPKKFQFKSARKATPAASPANNTGSSKPLAAPSLADRTSEQGTPSALRRALEAEADGVHGHGAEKSSNIQDDVSGLNISNREGAYCTRPASNMHASSTGTISSVKYSLIDLSKSADAKKEGPVLANLILNNVQKSTIICSHIDGPIHITGLQDSVLVAACRQFRMHGSKNVAVYLHCSSRPIIEDCENIMFAPLPSIYSPEEIAVTPNRWDQIDDFKWLKAEPSPHFSILPEEKRFKEVVWQKISSYDQKDHAEVATFLRDFKVIDE